MLIPGLPKGGMVFIESPTTRDRWRISTDNYVPVFSGERAEALRRNVAAGIPIEFTFEYGKTTRVRYETAPRGSIVAAAQFSGCIEEARAGGATEDMVSRSLVVRIAGLCAAAVARGDHAPCWQQ